MKSKISAYDLNCGCIEYGEDVSISKEHNVYHVKGWTGTAHFWESFYLIKEARAFFNSKDKQNREILTNDKAN